MASERPVVIFSKSSCCMCHSIKTLFCDFGVNPAVHELDEIPGGRELEQALSRLGCSPSVPAVFIGGELVGGANQVMSLHLKRSLIPMLKQRIMYMDDPMSSHRLTIDPKNNFRVSGCPLPEAQKLFFKVNGDPTSG
ncbi:hypothetical protein EZV62_000356 [Acer yangbiense]|uniref:Glutaredoxin domain-containing protein n=1 Tax=Acer yangbiense TaxID=1000413 RepID=A0A5C7IQU3_9ROSI|nr:hypothetical protein EZV62_000356 [Acer yangbiense]